MELTQLKYFLEVARTEHVTQSAKNLCIVQPALTQAIHKLEDELGVLLFKNSGRNIKLTDSGKFFYEKLQPLYENMMALPALLKETANKQNNNVKLNVLAASTLITSAVIEYRRSNSDIDVDIVQNEETSVFDICVRTYANYRPELDNTESDETFVHSEKIFLAVPNTAQYKKLNSISLFDLKDEKFIRLYGSKQYRQICNELCDSIGFHTNVTRALAWVSGRNSRGAKWTTSAFGSLKSPIRILSAISWYRCVAINRIIPRPKNSTTS